MLTEQNRLLVRSDLWKRTWTGDAPARLSLRDLVTPLVADLHSL